MIDWQSDFYWHWLRKGQPDGITGKYLFFSADQDALKRLAEEECERHGFYFAKVSAHASPDEYVLCLYWTDDSRKHELAERYKERTDIKYRFWKSNEATRKGKLR